MKVIGWMDLSLYEIIQEYAQGEKLSLVDVNRLCEIIKAKINLHLGNINEFEYNRILDGEVYNTDEIVIGEYSFSIHQDYIFAYFCDNFIDRIETPEGIVGDRHKLHEFLHKWINNDSA